MQRHDAFRSLAFSASLAVSVVPASAMALRHVSTEQAKPPQAMPSAQRGPTPRDVQRWARQVAGYPAAALMRELEGVVGVKVTVGPDGRVRNCDVTSSSGHDLLDDTACTSMQRYARFNPARDASGEPTFGTYATRIVFSLGQPEPAEPAAPTSGQ